MHTNLVITNSVIGTEKDLRLKYPFSLFDPLKLPLKLI